MSAPVPGAGGLAALAQAPLVAVLNHLLRGQPWLRERLLPFAGRTLRLQTFPVDLVLGVCPDGQLQLATQGENEDATVRASPLTLARLAAGDERARAAVEVGGDAAFAAVLAGVFAELRWDTEEDLSRVLGDIPARRLTQGAHTLLAWQRQAAANLLSSLAEYATEERPLLARRAEVADWVRAVDDLRERADRLDQRIERLARASGGKR